MEHGYNEIQAFIEQKITAAKKVICSGEQLEPECFFFVYYPGSKSYTHIPLSYIPHFFQANVSRRVLVSHIDRSYQIVKTEFAADNIAIEVLAVILINDGWWLRTTPEILETGEELPLSSEQPDRREAIVCFAHQKIERFLYFYPYDHRDGQVIFDANRQGGATPINQHDDRFNFDNLWPASA